MKKIFLSFIIVCLALAGMAQVRLGDFKIVNLRELLHSNGVDLIYEHPDSADQFKYVNMADPLEDLDGVNLRTLRRAIASSLDTIIIGVDTFLVMPADTFYNDFTKEWLHSGQHIVFPERDTFYNYFSGEWLSIGEGIEMPDSLYQEFNEHWLTFKDTIVHDDSIVYFREDPTCPGCFNYRMYGVPTWLERFCSETNLPNLRIANRSREALKIQEGYKWKDGTELTTRWFLGHFDPADSILGSWQPNKILHKSADSLKYKWIGTFIMNDTSIVIGDGAAATKAEQIALGDSSVLELWTAGNVSAKGYQIGGDSIYLNHLRNFASVDSGKFAMNNGDSVLWTTINIPELRVDTIYSSSSDTVFMNILKVDSVFVTYSEIDTIYSVLSRIDTIYSTSIYVDTIFVANEPINLKSDSIFFENIGDIGGEWRFNGDSVNFTIYEIDGVNYEMQPEIGDVLSYDGSEWFARTITEIDSFINLLDTPDEYPENDYGYGLIASDHDVQFASNFGEDNVGPWVQTIGSDTVNIPNLLDFDLCEYFYQDLSSVEFTAIGDWDTIQSGSCSTAKLMKANEIDAELQYPFEAIEGFEYKITVSGPYICSGSYDDCDSFYIYVDTDLIGKTPSLSYEQPWTATSSGTFDLRIVAKNFYASFASISRIIIQGQQIVDKGSLRVIDPARNDAYIFPGVDGQVGQVMSTDGNGKLGWANVIRADTIISLIADTVYIPALRVDTIYVANEPINLQSDSIYSKHELEWKSNGDTIHTGSIASKNFWTGTQAEYDAISPKDDNTIYFIEQGINPFMIILLLLLFFGRSCRAQSDWAAVYSGSTEMQKIYVGEKLVWQKETALDSVLICGEYYPIVIIGTQTWLGKNLHCDDLGGGVYSYDDDTDISDEYGYLYTWDAAVRVAASVDGWHLPSDEEWTTLTTYLGGTSVAGGKLKETGTTHWLSPNNGATNESGFTALPGGYRYINGTFNNIGRYGYWWSAAENNTGGAWSRGMYYNTSSVYRDGNGKEVGFSVRLIKD